MGARLAARGSNGGGYRARKRRPERSVRVHVRVWCSAPERPVRPAGAVTTVTAANLGTTCVASVQTAPSARGRKRQKASSSRAGGRHTILVTSRRPKGSPEAADAKSRLLRQTELPEESQRAAAAPTHTHTQQSQQQQRPISGSQALRSARPAGRWPTAPLPPRTRRARRPGPPTGRFRAGQPVIAPAESEPV